MDGRLEKEWLENSGKEPVRNQDLWQELDVALKGHQVQWKWVKGHAGHPENERVDQLAQQAVKVLRLRS